ncbi:MAG: DoxX family membrane protein [Candidatus Paceibacterota bacterium]
MLNPFPELLTFSFFAPFLLRLALAVFFLSAAQFHFDNRKKISDEIAKKWGSLGKASARVGSLVEFIIAILLLAGFYTQYAALLAIIVIAKMLFFKRTYPLIAYQSVWAYVFALVIAISLLITGAGAFAFDIPL